MKYKYAKIICFSFFIIIFGSGQVSKAFNDLNSIHINKEIDYLISQEGGSKKSDSKKSGSKKSDSKKSGSKKSDSKKSGSKKSDSKKSGSKKSDSKKSGSKKSGDMNKKNIFNKVQSNEEAMIEKAKERFKEWKENKNSKKQN